VSTLANALLKAEPPIPVLIYSSRGVFPSTGRASWWGCEIEKRDYELVVEWGLNRIGWLNGDSEVPEAGHGTGKESRTEMTVYCCVSKRICSTRTSPRTDILVTIQGYSHGSLLTPFTPSGSSSTSIHYRYILVSPPLGVAWFLHPFKGSSYDLALQRAMQRKSEGRGRERGVILVLYTTCDQFTSTYTYATWTRRLKAMASEVTTAENAEREVTKLFTDVEVEADHFWRSNTALKKLATSVHDWL
jgi:hypothetical protein